MPDTTFFKTEYTEAELKQCFEWFEQHQDRLPRSISLDNASNIPDLPFTVKRMITMLRNHAQLKSSVYNGYIANLLLIQHHLRQLPDWQE